MSTASQEYLPFIVLFFVCLSIRQDEGSFRNFASVAVGSLTVWVVSPTHSPWGKVISFGLLALAVAMSPLRLPLARAIKNLLLEILRRPNGPRPIQAITNPDPIKVLHNPPDADVDIVAVHGLGSSVETTWTHQESGKLWLRDFLHLDFKKARIMTYRHNSTWGSNALMKDLGDHGRQLLGALEGQRNTDESRNRPLIFIGHSFGGLAIEQALILAKRYTARPETRARYQSLTDSLAGVIFLGTPHAGSGYSFLGKVYCLFNYWEGANPLLLRYMDPESKDTRQLVDEFLKCYPDLSFDFYETISNVMLGIRFQMVVTREAGTRRGQEGSPLDTDHFGLNKYHSRDDTSYVAVRNKMQEMLDSWNHDKDYQLLKDLEPCNFTTTVEKRQGNLTPGTCKWIIEEEQFATWRLEKEKNVLWILGNPGSGKTYIAQWICGYLGENSNDYLMYFFFDAKNKDAKDLGSLEKFYQTILHQLLQGVKKARPRSRAECFESVRQIIRQGEPGETAYVDALRKVLSQAQPSFLVVDALDECKETETKVLEEWLAKIRVFPNLKIVITSRSLPPVEKLCDTSLHINLRLTNVVHMLNKDIERFIRSRIEEEERGFPADMERVVERLKFRSSGMILYARLMLDILENIVGSEDELLDEMDKLPKTLTALYADRLGIVKDKKFTYRILRWLVTCQRPLTVDALRGVDTVCRYVWPEGRFDLDEKNPPKEIQKDRRGNDRFRLFLLRDLLPLIEILDDNTVRLVHTTISQFLLGEEVEEDGVQCPAAFKVQLKDSHEHIAATCVTYLQWNFSVDASQRSGSLAFLDNGDLHDYAVLEWPEHCKKSQPTMITAECKNEPFMTFFRDKAFYTWVLERADQDGFFRSRFGLYGINPILPQSLHVAVFFDLWQFGRLLLRDTDIDLPDATGNTALHIAVVHGFLHIVKELLDSGARMDITDAANEYPLHKAVRWINPEKRTSSNLDIVRCLLEKSAPVDAKDRSWRTALHLAAKRGHLDVVDCLLHHGVNPNSLQGVRGTALFDAANEGHTEVVNRLLNAGTDSTIQDCDNRTALVVAARSGHSEILRMLLERTQTQPDKPKSNYFGPTALLETSACLNEGQEDIVDILFQYGVNPDARDKHGKTALHVALSRRWSAPTNALLDRLIRHGVPIDAQDNFGETALSHVTARRNLTAVRFLLNAGAAPVNNALHAAVKTGDMDLVQEFLKQRSKLDLAEVDMRGNTALHIAASKGYDQIVTALLRVGAPIRCLNKDQHTPLRAAKEANQDVTIILLQEADPILEEDLEFRIANIENSHLNPQDSLGRTLLHVAILLGRLDVVQTLLNDQADTEIVDLTGRTPLHYAAQRVDPAITEALNKAGARVDATDAQGKVPLYLAAEAGNVAEIGVLLAANAGLIASNEGSTPLHAATIGGSTLAVQILLKAEGGRQLIPAQDLSGRTAIHLAAESGNVGIIEELLKCAEGIAVLDTQEYFGRTALFSASENGHLKVVRQLVQAGSITYRTDKLRSMAIHLAAKKGHLKIVELLLSALPSQVELLMEKWKEDLPGCPKEYYVEQALFQALVEANAIVPHPGGPQFIVNASKWPTREQQQKLAKRALSDLWKFDNKGSTIPSTVLFNAVEGGHTDVVMLLLREAPDIPLERRQSHSGVTVLSLAARYGHFDIVKILISAGSKINAIDAVDDDNNEYDGTCLHEAAKHGHSEVVNLLLQEGANPMARTFVGYTPLHLAASSVSGDKASVQALVQVTRVNVFDNKGGTPLHEACECSNSAIVDILIDAGADLTAQDFNSRTPLDVAIDLNPKTRRRMEEQMRTQRVVGC